MSMTGGEALDECLFILRIGLIDVRTATRTARVKVVTCESSSRVLVAAA
jgi:hypothetical protein